MASSFAHAFKVFPRICNPMECRDNLKTRRTLTKRATLMTPSDEPYLVVYNAIIIKHGSTAARSIRLSTETKNLHFLGDDMKRTAYSRLNQLLLTISMIYIARISWSASFFPESSLHNVEVISIVQSGTDLVLLTIFYVLPLSLLKYPNLELASIYPGSPTITS